MMKENMNIRTALKERKLLDKKIEQLSFEAVIVKPYRADNPFIGMKTPDEFSEVIKSEFQSLQDMIKRREAINKAILDINAKTMIDVPAFVSFCKINEGETETISLAAAIARKNYYKNEMANYINRINDRIGSITREISNMQDSARKEIEKTIRMRFDGVQNISQSVYDEFVKQQEEKYEVKILNPLNIDSIMRDAVDKLNDYINNIDNKLSEKTETTYFDVEY